MSLRASLFLSTALTTVGAFWIAAPTDAADMESIAPDVDTYGGRAPAVSGPNFKFDAFGGWADASSPIDDYDEDLYGIAGSFTTPITHSFGLQIDGMVGAFGGDPFYGVAGHAFWRDPSIGLLGAYGSYTYFDRGPWVAVGVGSGLDVSRVAVEGELYRGSFTFRGLVGLETGDVDDTLYANLDFSWYVTPDAKLSIGYRHSSAGNALALGGEWLTPVSVAGGRPALFAEGRIGEEDHHAVWGGLRVYFGQSQTLIEKHRYDDPEGVEPDLAGIQELVGELDVKNCFAEGGGTSCAALGF
jgi:hypothetical protein